MTCTVGYATMNECYNEEFLSIKSGCSIEHRCYNERMQKRTVFINKIRMLNRTQILERRNATTKSFYQSNQDVITNKGATTKECYNEHFLSIKSGCYNEQRRYKERMQQRTVFINKIRMLQRTRSNTIGRRSTRVLMTRSIIFSTR